MILLTMPQGKLLGIAPENISAVLPNDDDSCRVFTVGDSDPYIVKTSQMDIARLRAAWELRFHSSELREKLPIAVEMKDDGIHFRCCEHTERLRQERLAAKQDTKPDYPISLAETITNIRRWWGG